MMKKLFVFFMLFSCLCLWGYGAADAEERVFAEGIYKVTFQDGAVTTHYIENVPLANNEWNNFSNGFIIHKDADQKSLYKHHGYIDEENERLVYTGPYGKMYIGIYVTDEKGNIIKFTAREISYRKKTKSVYVDVEKNHTTYELLQ